MEAEALILAGGKSTRMGGKHKGNLKFGEETFLEHLIKEMEREVQKIWISYGDKVYTEKTDIEKVCTGKENGLYGCCEIVMDEHTGCGPIGGIHAALKKCHCETVFVAACDMPFLKMELYQFLEEFLSQEQDGIVPVAEGRVHPLAAIYKKSIFPVLEEQIKGGNYRMKGMLEKINVRYVDVSGYPKLCQMLKNINTVEEYQKLLECQCGRGIPGA